MNYGCYCSSNSFAYQMEQTSKREEEVRLRTRELFESERSKRELEESYETMKRYLDEALKEVSVWKKRRS